MDSPAARPTQTRPMITVTHLTKRYGSSVAVEDVSFSCAPGTITGFLGPNGAGKSTTLRMLTGLTPPTSGTASIHGRAYRDLPNPGRVIGVMLDAAAVHAGRTGQETLRITAQILGQSAKKADLLLEQVGLADAALKRVGQYSLGMRQRLGIAVALLGEPTALILDEPANGLDPEGIRWMRELLQDFAGGGGTVLLSSHLLTEVQATVDRLVVIGRGRIVADGALGELLAQAGTFVRALDPLALQASLSAAGLSTTGPAATGGLTVEAGPEQIARIAAATGNLIVELRPAEGQGLEELFFRLTADSDRTQQAA